MVDSILNPGGSIGAALSTPSVTNKKTAEKLDQAGDFDETADSSNVRAITPDEDVTKRLEAVSINSFMQVAASALDEIVSIREQQLELAEEAKNEVNGERRSDLDSELRDLEAEIVRIGNDASFNDKAVFGSISTFSVTSSQESIGEASVNSDPSNLFLFATANIADLPQIETTETTLKQLLTSTRTARSDAESSVNETERDLEKLLDKQRTERANQPERVKTEEEAEELVTEIAQEITSQAKVLDQDESTNTIKNLIIQGSESSGLLVNDLDPDRVEELLKG